MNIAFAFAAALAAIGAASHAYLGERLVLAPLFRGDGVPESPFGGAASTRFMLRSVWHFFTIVGRSAAVFFLILSTGDGGGANGTASRIIGSYFAVGAPFVLLASRGRHFAWLLASGIAAGAWLGTV